VNDATPEPDMQPPPHESRLHRFVSSAGHLIGTTIEMGLTRLELLFVDLQEWVEGLLRIFFWAIVMIFAASMCLLLGSFALIFVFWDTHRVLVAGLETATFALLTVAAWQMVKRRMLVQRSLLTSTFAEFAKDRELFKRPPRTETPSSVPPGVPFAPTHAAAPAPVAVQAPPL
jgi:uncharacterized membrane protein YqjE